MLELQKLRNFYNAEIHFLIPQGSKPGSAAKFCKNMSKPFMMHYMMILKK